VNVGEVSGTQNEVGDGPEMQARSVAIHEAIKAMRDLDLSNPSTFTTLPFPSLLPMPPQRFERRKVGDMNYFEYMGRNLFSELHKRIQDANFLDRTENLYLYGTSGSGKSHLLAALAYTLIRERKRVFYIPDCSTFLLGPAEIMWKALQFAFHDSNILKTIKDRYDTDELIHFISKHRDLYIIVDQVNALEDEESNTCKAKECLKGLRLDHLYIFSASANEAPTAKLIRGNVELRFSEYLEG